MIAILSDVHGNLEALEAALDDAKREGAKRFVCLGDIVGYGADPNRCVERIREVAEASVLGNHDQAALDPIRADNFNAVARQAIEWTRGQLTQENLETLRRTPLDYVDADARFVHATPDDPLSWNYVLTVSEALDAFGAFGEAICFIGHSHVPVRLLLRNGELAVAGEMDFAIRSGDRALVNVGSVGQPRDGDWRASYALYEPDSRHLTARRVEYDRDAAASKILAAGLPEILARRLALGR